MANKKLTPNKKSAPKRAFDAAVNTYKKAEVYGTEQLMSYAKDVGVKIDQNIYPGLTVEEHKSALIESCIKTDSIFSDKITDKPEAKSTQLQNYMFYNQLYFLAIAQLSQPDAQGSLMTGLVSSLSMIAGAAIVSQDFRQNLKEHAEDALIKYVEPFKKDQPKLWHELSARVESHPGCESPEGIAIKLLRYQYQAAEAISNGASTREMNQLLLKKTAELKTQAKYSNISWETVIDMRNELSAAQEKSELDKETEYGANWKNQSKMYLNSKSDGLGEKVGVEKMSFSVTKDWIAPIDKHSVAQRLVAYQRQLQEAVHELHAHQETGKKFSSKYEHLEGKKEHELFADALDEVAALKVYAEESLGLKWSEVATEYDKLNRERYDVLHSVERKYLGKPHKHDVPIPYTPTKEQYLATKQAIRDHNDFMHYELPVDAASAGRCLKKYQQDAYENVRNIATRHNYTHKAMDSRYAYDLSNRLCQNVEVASKVLGFSMEDAGIEYYKDVYNTIRRDKDKSVIWREIADGDVIANIPTYTTVYSVGEDGKSLKHTKPLSERDQIREWNGVMYDASGNKLKPGTLFQIRNPYTQGEAEIAYMSLLNEQNSVNLKITELREQGKSTHQAEQQLADIEKRFDEMDKSLFSDGFTPDDIAEIQKNATELLATRLKKYTEMYDDKKAKLNESLLRTNDGPDNDKEVGPDYC